MSDIGEQNNSENGKLKDKKTLLELYELYSDDLYEMGNTDKEILTKIVDIEDTLYGQITGEQRKMVENMQELECERAEQVYKNIFVNTFRLATKLLLEAIQ